MTVTILPAAPSEGGESTLQDELAFPIVLTERLLNSSESTHPECAKFIPHVRTLSQMLCTVVRLTSSLSPATIYDRPIRRISAKVAKNLVRALNLVRKCRHTGFLRHVFLTTAADFEKVSNLLESSIGDLKWLIAIFDADDEDGANTTMPPIAKDDPILAWVWTPIASLHMNRQSRDRVQPASQLATLAQNESYRKAIVEEGGISLLLRLLKDGGGLEEGQIAAAEALFWLEHEIGRNKAVAHELGSGFPLIAQVLGDSPVKVQGLLADLVARVAEILPSAGEVLGRENVIKPLISCLLIGLDLQDYKKVIGTSKNSIHSTVKNELAAKNTCSDVNSNRYNKVELPSLCSDGKGSGDFGRKVRKSESPEVVYELKTKCAVALRRLCKGSVSNIRRLPRLKGCFVCQKLWKLKEENCS